MTPAHGLSGYTSKDNPCRCDVCNRAHTAYCREWRERNKDKIQERRRVWRAANPERVHKYQWRSAGEQHPNLKPLASEIERAWAAGFFDGEGCFGVGRSLPSKANRYGSVCPHASISQIDPQVLYRFQRAIGGLGTVRGPISRKNRGPNFSPIWKWQVGAWQDVRHVIKVLWPYLSPVKQQQALAAGTAYLDHHTSAHDRRVAGYVKRERRRAEKAAA